MSVAVGIYLHILEIVDDGNLSTRFNSPTIYFSTKGKPGIETNCPLGILQQFLFTTFFLERKFDLNLMMLFIITTDK